MNETPILFSAPMVKALLAATKTVTRRLVTPRPPSVEDVHAKAGISYSWFTDGHARSRDEFRVVGPVWAVRDLSYPTVIRCPYGAPGDRLWVKETWRPSIAHGHGMDACDCADVMVRYAADGEGRLFNERDIPAEWTMPKAARTGNVTPLFMPRWASRITLEMTDIRVERLQDITETDALAEGIHEFKLPNGSVFGTNPCPAALVGGTAVEAFASLWDHINGRRAAWSSNPWLWVVSFRRVAPC